MKKLLWAVLLLIGAISHSFAQTYKFYAYLPDKTTAAIKGFDKTDSTITPVFSDAGINTIISNYQISEFHKAFPTSDYEYLRHCYKVVCNSANIFSDLQAYDSIMFPHYQLLDSYFIMGYTPNDSGLHYDKYLWQYGINAAKAFGYTKGDPNIIIGCTDTYFDVSHPDMQGKYAKVLQNNVPSSHINHGTLVGGLIAATTDNKTGFPGSGFNCRLEVSSQWGIGYDSVLLGMAKDTAKVLSASWGGDPKDSIYWPKYFDQQGVYNEIYEHGTTMVFSAGNGPSQSYPAYQYLFPASLDHNISVSNTGWENDTTANLFNAQYVHEFNAGDSTNSYQHNSRVDILAPSVRIGGHDFDPNDTSVHYQHATAWGTSFGAPMVAGTVGLMLSVKPWLTPYQVEYLLKTSSTDITHVTWNKKYAGTNRYNGRIGAGALDAGEAVEQTVEFISNNPDATTFRILGIDLNTKCSPNVNANLPQPKLKVKLANGIPPYKYRWEPYSDNNANLALGKPDSPIVYQTYGTHLLHWRLTVYDNSPIQKVANMDVKIQFNTDSTTWDLSMRDAYADMLNERNNMDSVNAKEWNIWESPDIWNRQLNDSILVHQDPEYFNNAPNYLYVRIKNVGCKTSPYGDSAQMRLYWTISNTGETWPIDWDGTTSLFNQPGGNSCGQFYIPSIKSGQEVIIQKDWYPPRPQDYDSSWNKLDVCVLARIINPIAANDGMTIPEDSLTKENVWNNNNIVTRNLEVTNFNNANKTTTIPVIVANGTSTPTTFSWQVITGQQIKPYLEGHPADYLIATFQLGHLYDKWANGGKVISGGTFDDENKTITWDLEHPLRLDNITLDNHERYVVMATLALKDGVSIPYDVRDERVFMRQLVTHSVEVDNGDGTTFFVKKDEVYGNVGFALNIDHNTEESESKQSPQILLEETEAFTGYPNPTSDNFTIQATGEEKSLRILIVVDLAGRIVVTKKNISFRNDTYKLRIADLQPGIYFIKMTDSKNQVHVLKFMKIE